MARAGPRSRSAPSLAAGARDPHRISWHAVGCRVVESCEELQSRPQRIKRLGAKRCPVPFLVEIAFSADRNQLFAAWNAVANLADLAGKVSVTLRAESEKGFDRSKLQNGVIEPLKEADVIE